MPETARTKSSQVYASFFEYANTCSAHPDSTIFELQTHEIDVNILERVVVVESEHILGQNHEQDHGFPHARSRHFEWACQSGVNPVNLREASGTPVLGLTLQFSFSLPCREKGSS